MAGDLHAILSAEGADVASDWAVIGGALLERFDAAAGGVMRRRPDRASPITARQILETDFERLKWRRGLSGVGYCRTGAPGSRFMRLRDDEAAPRHNHNCLEATVVLTGSFEDGRGTYHRGDLVLASEGDEHKPRGVGGDCICFVARERGRLWIM
ncbi:MAG: cupin domain-containing protein [Pseudomonadota bacterium]